MKSVMCAVAVVLAGAVPAVRVSAEDKKPEVRPLKDVKFAESEAFGVPKPLVISTADELAKSKAFADDAGREAAKKQVDFATEKLVVFAWSGSGRDRLTPELKTDGKKVTAVFAYKVGETDDLRRHAVAFVVPKDATVEVRK
jgi:hypothetical protein